MAVGKIIVPREAIESTTRNSKSTWYTNGRDENNKPVSIKVQNGRVYNDDYFSEDYGSEIFDFDLIEHENIDMKNTFGNSDNKKMDITGIKDISDELLRYSSAYYRDEAIMIFNNNEPSVSPIKVDDQYINDLKSVMKNAANYSSMGLDSDEMLTKILPYSIVVEEFYKGYSGNSMSMEEKISIAKKLMDYDASKGYVIRSTVAVVKNGVFDDILGGSYGGCKFEGTWLEFYSIGNTKAIVPLTNIKGTKGNYYEEKFSDATSLDEYIKEAMKYNRDIVKESSKYSDKFKNVVFNGVSDIKIVNIENVADDWPTNTSYINKGITVNLGNSRPYDEKVDYMTNALGLSFNDLVFTDAGNVSENLNNVRKFTDSDEWKDIYKQVCAQYESSVENYPLDKSATKNEKQLFAKCTAEYFGGRTSKFKPDDLKSININVHDQTISLYEYMHSILE